MLRAHGEYAGMTRSMHKFQPVAPPYLVIQMLRVVIAVPGGSETSTNPIPSGNVVPLGDAVGEFDCGFAGHYLAQCLEVVLSKMLDAQGQPLGK